LLELFFIDDYSDEIGGIKGLRFVNFVAAVMAVTR
jgi:hypothetical protein